jgi:hypothetical protein
VINKLPEEHLTGQNVRIVRRRLGRLAHLRRQLLQQFVRRPVARRVLEHEPKAGLGLLSCGQCDVTAPRIANRMLPRLVRRNRQVIGDRGGQRTEQPRPPTAAMAAPAPAITVRRVNGVCEKPGRSAG